MSGVVKSTKKVFKKVGKVVKKVAPYALAAGAVLYTAGAALGIGAAAGGWGAAASGLSSSLGLSGTLGNVVTGALTQAGYGAATGAATSALTGGDIEQGALLGAAGGAVTGGVSGAAGWQTDPLKDAFADGVSGGGDAISGESMSSSLAKKGASQGVPDLPGFKENPAPIIRSNLPNVPIQSGIIDDNVVIPPGLDASRNAGTGGGLGGLFRKGGWLERNQELVGGAVKGVAGGLLQGMQAGDAAEAQAAADEARAARIAANYRTGDVGLIPARTDPNLAAARLRAGGSNYPTVYDKYNKASGYSFRYKYNPKTGQIEASRELQSRQPTGVGPLY